MRDIIEFFNALISRSGGNAAVALVLGLALLIALFFGIQTCSSDTLTPTEEEEIALGEPGEAPDPQAIIDDCTGPNIMIRCTWEDSNGNESTGTYPVPQRFLSGPDGETVIRSYCESEEVLIQAACVPPYLENVNLNRDQSFCYFGRTWVKGTHLNLHCEVVEE